MLGLGVSWSLLDVAAAAPKDPAAARPTPGDQLVFVLGDRKGQVVKVEDLALGGPQELAYPMDPATKVVRDATRLNQVLLIRLDPAELKPDARANAAEGVVAYSAICTHQGCDVSQWKPDSKMLLCVCHGSEYDPRDRAKVTFGPAPRRLAMLPVKTEGGVLVVAGPFKGKVGFMDL
ncbi:MAG TPA: Rieske (2Fe-2S) protein [Burkholderiales bacterium]|nr:Rieske (2Fe-2S) protein [Burkholderiales bacterium]